MSAAVATEVRGDLVAARSRLREMRAWIEESDDPRLLGSAVKTLYEVREWARIRKLTTDLRAEATRLEAVALRNLALLGRDVSKEALRDAGLPAQWMAAGNGFASLSDEEFEDLLRRADEALSPHALWRIVLKERQRNARFGEAASFLSGQRSGPHDRGDIEPRDLAGAVRTVLTAALAEGDSFTVSEVTDELVRWIADSTKGRELLREGSTLIDDPDFRAGMREVVRKALDTEPPAPDARIPAFVTYFDGDESWTRIPWSRATLDELVHMARFRRKQADDMARAAGELEEVVDYLGRISLRLDGERRLQHLAHAAARESFERSQQVAERMSAAATCPTCHLTMPCDCEVQP